MKKIIPFTLLLTCSITYAYRDTETGTFLTRDPLGYQDGPNLYCYVHCNPITRFDSFGLYGEDMHYLGAFIAMRAAGVAKGKALKTSYYSAYPDQDSNYNATALKVVVNTEKRNRAASIHMLTGSSTEEVLKTRETLSKQIPKNGSKSAGVKLHMYGDTFGHLRLDSDPSPRNAPAARHKGIGSGFRGGKPNGGSKDSTYLFGGGEAGHAFDGTRPDQVRFRPDLAKDYIKGVFDMFGGEDKSGLEAINEAIDNVADGTLSMKLYRSEIQKIAESWGMTEDQTNIGKVHDTMKQDPANLVTEEKMKTILNDVHSGE